MIINCANCKKSLNIPDDKVPEGKTISFNCPACNHQMKLVGGKGVGDPGAAPLDETQTVPMPAKKDERSESSLMSLLDMVEDELEFLGEGKFRALLADSDNIDRITPVLKKMEYSITTVKSHEEGISKLTMNTYDLLVLNEKFKDCDPYDNPLHKYVEPMPMIKRRKMFVVLIGHSFQTMDSMDAFNKSVNLVMNVVDFSNFELILKKSMNDMKAFYAVFNQISVESGQEFSI